MSRLTKTDRDQIVAALLKHKFGAIQDEITKEFVALGSVIVEQVKIQDADQYPREWFARRDSFSFSTPGDNTGYVDHNHVHGKTVYKVKKGWAWRYRHYTEVALPYRHRDGDIRLGVDSKFAPMLEDIGARCIAYLERREEAEAIARRTISRFSTAKSLVKAWPEIEPFVPVAAVSSGNLPALQVDEMNKIFGLKA